MILAAIAEVMQLVPLIEMKKGYMQSIAEIEAAYSGLEEMDGIEMQGLLLQVQGQLQMPVQVSVQVVAADKTD